MKEANQKLWTLDAEELLRTMLSLRTIDEAKMFLRDLLTEGEIQMIVERWRVARLLDEGRSYREISSMTGLSSRTIARISRWLQEGAGGYRALLERRKEDA